MPREIREQKNANFRKTLFSNFPAAPLYAIRRRKGGICCRNGQKISKIFYAAKNRMYTNTPAAIWQNRIAGMPKRNYQCRVLW